MNRKSILLGLMTFFSMSLFATSTTYTFTNQTWSSKVGTISCDGTTDGWTNIMPAKEFWAGQGAKVNVKSSDYDGEAKTESVISFENVRKVIVHYCTNSKKGAGSISVLIDDTTMTANPTTEGGTTVRDMVFELQKERTGKITLDVKCTTNAIFINGITIKADNGSGEEFSAKVYHLVTDVAQLKDSDIIMIGIADGKTNKVLGYFDESISKNNIHAVSAKYSDNREYVNGIEDVSYVLRTATSEKGQKACYTIYDPFAEAFVVASGGKTKNALRIWDKAYDPNTYGDYGYWDIQVAANGEATIMCLGNSLGKYIQYNPTFNLFGAYQEMKMTPVSIYRQEEAKDLTKPLIVVPLANFGTEVMRTETELNGSKTIEVKANKLTENMTATLKEGTTFSLSTTTLDRDGDKLTILYHVTAPGKYIDTLTIANKDTSAQVLVHLNVAKELTIAEAVTSGDFEYIYLNPVTVTKKYDRMVYVRDATGAMMLYDEGPDNARFAKDMVLGNVLNKVEGKFQNYWGVPELHLMAKPDFNKNKTIECLPDTMTVVADSADVCRYIYYDSVAIVYGKLEDLEGTTIDWPAVEVQGNTLLLSEFFTLPDKSESMAIIENRIKEGNKYYYDVEGIVSYDYDDVVLYPTMITLRETPDPEDPDPDDPDPEDPDPDDPDPEDPDEAIDNLTTDSERVSDCYNILGQRVDGNYRGVIILKGQKRLITTD